ncbi:MAG: glycoside hydrolase family 113 [Patescibacteria group bacterium]
MTFFYRTFKVLLPIVILTVFFNAAPYVNAATNTWQKGLTLRLTNESQKDVEASIVQMAETGANYLTITPGYEVDNKYASNVDPKSRTPSDEILIFAINKAHELDMQVMIKPHIDRKDGGWRAFINPTNKAEFFKNYKNMILHYAVLGEQYGVEQLSIGAETYELSTNPNNEQYWRDIISEVRKVYSGKLTYSANSYSEYFDEGNLPFGDLLDVWGMSMYVELAANNNPQISELLEQWKKVETDYIYPIYEKWKKPIIFAETGYRSIDGAGMEPDDFSSTAKVDLEEQNTLYKAMFEFWKDKDYFAGLHIWDWKPDVNAGGDEDTDYTPQNKPAQETIKQYFTQVSDNSSEETQNESTSETTTAETNAAELILNLKPTEYLIKELKTELQYYFDRNYEITQYPELLNGTKAVVTRNGDKYNNSETFVSFKTNIQLSIFLAYDARATQLPNWLSNWEKTPMTIQTTDNNFMLLVKNFEANETVNLGGNSATGMVGSQSNYFLILKEGKYENTSTTTETQTQSPETTTETPPNEIVEEEIVEEIPTEEPATESNINGTLKIDYPETGDTLSGERKLKAYIEGLATNKYYATYSKDGSTEIIMDYGSDDKYQQEKIDFGEWNDKNGTPYTIEVKAYDLENNLIDKTSIQIYIK